MTPLRTLTVTAVAAGGLAGCVTPKPPAPATTSFLGPACISAPNLASAVSLAPPKPKAVHTVTTAINAQSSCLARPAGATPYVLYALPADPAGKTLTIGGVLEAARIVPPEVVLLDQTGRPVRTFAPTQYYFRGPVYSVQFTPRAGEAYALTTVDVTKVGKQYESIAIGTGTTSTYAAGATISITVGRDAAEKRTFSYEGSIQASVFDSNSGKARD